jgi:hypothetical protein
MRKIKVTGYKNFDKDTYETSKRSLGFEANINGIPIRGYWSPIREYTHDGVEINEIEINDGSKYPKLIRIFNGGGSTKTFEIYSRSAIKLKEKQPRNLQFTGRNYDISGLKDVFKQKMKEIEEGKHCNILSEEFKKYFLGKGE